MLFTNARANSPPGQVNGALKLSSSNSVIHCIANKSQSNRSILTKNICGVSKSRRAVSLAPATRKNNTYYSDISSYWDLLSGNGSQAFLGQRAKSASDAAALRRKGHLKEQDRLIDFMRNLLSTHTCEEVMAKMERWIAEHHRDPVNSRLQRLIPGMGQIFSPLPLVEAFKEYDAFFALSRRKYVPANFAELRHIVNIAQVCASAPTLKLITFDADGTLYADGAHIGQDNQMIAHIVNLMCNNVHVAIVTAAGYPGEPRKFERRVQGLLAAFKRLRLSEEITSRFHIMGGECNYLLRVVQTPVPSAVGPAGSAPAVPAVTAAAATSSHAITPSSPSSPSSSSSSSSSLSSRGEAAEFAAPTLLSASSHLSMMPIPNSSPSASPLDQILNNTPSPSSSSSSAVIGGNGSGNGNGNGSVATTTSSWMSGGGGGGVDYRLEFVEDRDWKTPAMLGWDEREISMLLDDAEILLKETTRRLNLSVTIIRKPRAVGVVPNQPTIYEVLEELALTLQNQLRHSSIGSALSMSAMAGGGSGGGGGISVGVDGGSGGFGGVGGGGMGGSGSGNGNGGSVSGGGVARRRLPFCAFNGGNDVFLDVGNKMLGLEALSRHLGVRTASQEILHVGDRFTDSGNDVATRDICSVLWVANPEETGFFMRMLLGKLRQQRNQPYIE